MSLKPLQKLTLVHIAIVGILACTIAQSKSRLPIPRFVSLKPDEVNLRSGPGFQYPIKWSYKRKGYPMEVSAEFENWRQLRDIDGTEGWVNGNLITPKRRIVAIPKGKINTGDHQEIMLLKYPNETARPVVRIEYGVIGDVKKCNQHWCKVVIRSYSGWIKKENIWGVYKDEIIR
ncbi:hypothetical protein EDM53_03250 [Rickettsiales endosymbiont of Peranema trichophorum]|uniref:SH3 domain-containing protein n=1 Tax=Rickettsiales endosymbiont of Peranema trichophorum TaxID=2486577 RepID=UPI0010230E47|nr:SH3 domain-containing protein [Rickettsiales endosymbiont of Peranema trichophorum]RZI47230.1 hypothetical protein EDM53_03250 [Rickettsiales endosymbiont of Peranema trichophorum]